MNKQTNKLTKTRAIALLLVLVMVLTTLPLNVMAAAEVTVFFHSGGGTGTMASQTAAVDTPFILPANGFTPHLLFQSRTFDGWLVSGGSPQAGDILPAGAAIDVTSDVTLTAQWSADPISTRHGMPIFTDSTGIEWIILTEYPVNSGNFLIMTEHVFGGWTSAGGVNNQSGQSPYNLSGLYTRLSYSDLRNHLNN